MTVWCNREHEKDLEMNPKNSAELSSNAGEESEISTNATSLLPVKRDEEDDTRKEETADSLSASASCLSIGPSLIRGDTTDTKKEESVNTSVREVDKGRKSSKRSKTSRGKVKGKVDWTTELHRQFVQAVEQLGVDNAVPSKILELMGIDYLSRHNVASHLQKYRSHQKHLLARETEAAKWSLRRQSFGSTGAIGKRDSDSWAVPVTGFPPVTPRPHFRPFHAWGHPFVDQSYMYMWPKPPPIWGSPQFPLPGDPSLWYYHQQDVTAPGIPCIVPPFLPTGFPPPQVAGTLPATISTVQALPKPRCDFNIPTESIDAVIGDVLSKPWLPLPLGLNPPSIDCIITELQRQGISKITQVLPLKKRQAVLRSKVSDH